MASPSSEPTSNANAAIAAIARARGADRVQHRLGREQCPEDDDVHGCAGHGDRRSECDMPKAAMAELVCDDSQHLGLAGLLDERVVEHHPPRRSQPGDVRVQLRRPPARVGHEHLADRYARATASRSTASRSPGSSSGRKRLKTGSSTIGRNEAEQEDEERGSDAGNQRPGRRKCAGAEDEAGEAGPVRTESIVNGLQLVEREGGCRFPREAEAALVHSPSQTVSGSLTRAERTTIRMPSRNAPSTAGSPSTMPEDVLAGRT